jgi:SAM-dependent methyltransferase
MTELISKAGGIVHEKLVFGRRARVLSDWFAEFVPRGARVLDVGCGDGLISALLKSKRADIEILGTDVLPRSSTHVPVHLFDGSTLPFDNGVFDVALFSDVLHHTDDPKILLREASRVAHRVLIKDHYREGFGAGPRLRFMDWVGNSRFGVALPYNYWSKTQWNSAWVDVGLQPERTVSRLNLYPAYANWLFGAHLHFITLLKKAGELN